MNKARNKPKQQRAKLTVEAILEATQELMKEVGFEQISTNKIAKKAGVSIGSIYQFFPNKEAIYQAVEERMIDTMSKDATEIMAKHGDSTAVELAEVLLEVIFARANEYPDLIPLVSRLMMNPNGSSALVRLQENIIIAGRQLLLRNKRHIEFEDAHTTSYMLCNLCVLLLCQFFAQPQSYVTQAQFKEELLTIISARMQYKRRE